MKFISKKLIGWQKQTSQYWGKLNSFASDRISNGTILISFSLSTFSHYLLLIIGAQVEVDKHLGKGWEYLWVMWGGPYVCSLKNSLNYCFRNIKFKKNQSSTKHCKQLRTYKIYDCKNYCKTTWYHYTTNRLSQNLKH